MNKTQKKHPTFGDITAILAIIVSVISLVITIYMNSQTVKLTKRLNSEEYQISEKLKYDLMQLIAVLKTINAKTYIEGELDFSYELEELKRIQTTPGYHYFLNRFDNVFKKIPIEYGVLQLTDLISSGASKVSIKAMSKIVLDELGNSIDLQRGKEKDFEDVLRYMCLKDGGLTTVKKHNELEMKELEDWHAFFHHLVDEGIEDPDVLYFLGVLHEDKELIQSAKESGASVQNGSDIIKRYQNEYYLFCKAQKE